MKTLILLVGCLLLAHTIQARPQQHQALKTIEFDVDVVGDVDGTVARVKKAVSDTTWIATWNFEGCDETGWVRADNYVRNDGNVYWSVNANFDGTGNVTGDAAVVGSHNVCWAYQDGYDNGWYQGICIQYVGDSFLSFDYLLDSEADFDFLQVEIDSACSSFNRVDYSINTINGAQSFRDEMWSASGFDTVSVRVDSLPLSGYATGDTHCVYIAFYSDIVWSPADGLVPTVIGAGAVVDNVLLEGALASDEDFTGFTETVGFSFLNIHDSKPFGTWARTYSHITDNDRCTENPGCTWLATDHTTPTLATEPSMAFGPNGYVIRNWLDEVVVGPWVSLSSTASAISTIVQFRRFGGNNFSTSRAVQNWSIRGRSRVANTDTPVVGDSIDCVSSWGHIWSWNSLTSFSWRTLSWDATSDFDHASREVQLRFRQSDWQMLNGASPPTPFSPGPGPFWDRVRIGRQLLSGPVIDEGIDARYQAQDAAPNDPSHEAGPMYAQATGVNEIFGTVAFSMSNGNGYASTPNLIVGDSITIWAEDILGSGGVNVSVHAAIVGGPHAGKAPAPYTVGGNGFFVIMADSTRVSDGTIIADNYFVDMDDTYFRGGDVVRYFWWVTDQQGRGTSNPSGLTTLPTAISEAESTTGGLFEVNFLPTINWDPAYLTRVVADPHGDLDPTPTELANSSQANCILYNQSLNARRRSGDVNRTSFMYTLDSIGYRDKYDVHDHIGWGNTNNHLGARMSPLQANRYSLIIFDAGNRGSGGLLPDGINLDSEKINMSSWFQTWNGLSGAPNPEHTLWFVGSNIAEGRPSDPLFTAMGVGFVAPDQSQDANPDVFGRANFMHHTSCIQAHIGEEFALDGGCPVVRNYDDIRPIGGGVQTHLYGKGVPGTAGAVVMNASIDGYTTIMQSFPWGDIRSGEGQVPTTADDEFMKTILNCVLPLGCVMSTDSTTAVDDDGKDRIAVPSRTMLHQNTPNPFNPTTTINFDLARDSHVSLQIYDVAGRLVRGLANEKMTAGFSKQVLWNGLDDAGRRVSSGVYFYRLTAADFRATRKLVIMK